MTRDQGDPRQCRGPLYHDGHDPDTTFLSGVPILTQYHASNAITFPILGPSSNCASSCSEPCVP